jgi:hypothetical protein
LSGFLLVAFATLLPLEFFDSIQDQPDAGVLVP